MLRVRIIPMLLLDGRRLVKTRRFRSAQYVGDPINVVRIFNEKEVDELFIADITASKEQRAPDFGLLEQIASEAFMPICYAGAVRTVEHARTLLRLGVEKVALNTAALQDPALVGKIADQFGSQCVVASLDVKRTLRGRYEVYSHAGATIRERDPVRFAQALVAAGAGEVLVNCVDRDGMQNGLDRELIRAFEGRLSAPLVLSGGAAGVEDMIGAVRSGTLSGIAVGAHFVFFGPRRAVLVTYLDGDALGRIQQAAAGKSG